jgi:hypothetical protein
MATMSASSFIDKAEDQYNRLTYRKVFMRPPGLNADIQSVNESVNAIVDTEFELLGTNAVSADATIDTTGGTKLSTHGASGDSTILLPHLDASQSAWTTTLWDTAKSPTFETLIKTGANITATTIYAGLKLTNTDTIATDDDQIFFRYQDTAGSGSWQFTVSRAGTDETYTVPTTVCAAVAVSTLYKLRIEVYSDRTCQGFINDIPVRPYPFAAVTSLTTLIPYVGIKAAAVASKTCTVKYVECGRAH